MKIYIFPPFTLQRRGGTCTISDKQTRFTASLPLKEVLEGSPERTFQLAKKDPFRVSWETDTLAMIAVFVTATDGKSPVASGTYRT